MKYDFAAIEKKWQDRWDEAGIFRASDDRSKKKFYALVEFPYPSGAGMHVGHIKAYSGLEVISRKRRMEGYNVLFPIGFDAFGLPTENYAVKTNTHPRIVTDRNIKKFTSSCAGLASPSTGPGWWTLRTRTTISGPSGSSARCLTRGWFSAPRRL